jgi:hypothetical protein
VMQVTDVNWICMPVGLLERHFFGDKWQDHDGALILWHKEIVFSCAYWNCCDSMGCPRKEWSSNFCAEQGIFFVITVSIIIWFVLTNCIHLALLSTKHLIKASHSLPIQLRCQVIIWLNLSWWMMPSPILQVTSHLKSERQTLGKNE